MISVLLVDPCQIIRAGIRTFLSQDTGIQLLEEAPRGTHVIEVVARRKPTVVLMETSLLEGSSVPVSQAIRQSSQTSRVLFFSALVDQAALRATALGEAEGYLLKDANADEVIRAVRTVAEGHTYLDPRLAKQILDTLREGVRADSTAKPKRLSDQEQKVIAYLAEGKTNKEIAVSLELSELTVKNYLSHAYEKFHLHRRAEAAAWYVRHCTGGVCPPDPPGCVEGESPCFVHLESLAVHKEPGRITQWRTALLDVSERKRAEDAHTLLANIVESSDDGIHSMDLAGIIVTWNQGAEQLYGYTREEIIGHPITRLIPAERLDEKTQVFDRIRRGGTGSEFHDDPSA